MILFFAFKTLADPQFVNTQVTYPLDAEHSTAYKPNPTSETLSVPHSRLPELHGAHSITASHTISEEALRQYLESVHSPLAGSAREIIASPFWSTIVAITAAEQSFSKRPVSSPFNLWGRMYPRCCILKKYPDFPTAIADMDAYFRDYWEEQRDIHTIEGLNGRYVVPASDNWLRTVINTKNELESL